MVSARPESATSQEASVFRKLTVEQNILAILETLTGAVERENA